MALASKILHKSKCTCVSLLCCHLRFRFYIILISFVLCSKGEVGGLSIKFGPLHFEIVLPTQAPRQFLFVMGGKILPAESSVSMVVFDRSKQLSTMTCGKSGNERKPFCPRPNKARTTERKKVSVKYLKPLNFLYIWYNYFDAILIL